MYLHRLIGVGIHRYRDGDAMITITHTGECYSIDGRRLMVGRIDGARNYKQASYAVGEQPPNYPMPAIVARVEYFDDGIEWLQHSQVGEYYVIRDWDYI